MDKVESMQGQMGNVNRDVNPKKQPKRNATDQKHTNKNEECLQLVHWTQLRKESEVEDIVIETAKTK